MPDIILCCGANCPLKESCARFTSYTDQFDRSYFMEIPYDYENKRCDHIIYKEPKNDVL